MPRKSIQPCVYWWPKSGAKPSVLLALERPPAISRHPCGPDIPRQPGGSAIRAPECAGASPRCSRASRRGESALRLPAERDGRRAHLRPAPVDPVVERVRERADARPPGRRRGRSSSGRRARRPGAARCPWWTARRPGSDAPSPARGSDSRSRGSRCCPTRAESCGARQRNRSVVRTRCAGCVACDVAAFDADRIRGQRESDRADAHERTGRPPVRREPRRGSLRLPEVVEMFAARAYRGTRSRGRRGCSRCPPPSLAAEKSTSARTIRSDSMRRCGPEWKLARRSASRRDRSES